MRVSWDEPLFFDEEDHRFVEVDPERIDHAYELAKNLIRLGDPEACAENLSANILAYAYLTGVTPATVTKTLDFGSPKDDDWRDRIHPILRGELT